MTAALWCAAVSVVHGVGVYCYIDSTTGDWSDEWRVASCSCSCCAACCFYLKPGLRGVTGASCTCPPLLLAQHRADKAGPVVVVRRTAVVNTPLKIRPIESFKPRLDHPLAVQLKIVVHVGFDVVAATRVTQKPAPAHRRHSVNESELALNQLRRDESTHQII